MLPFRIRSAFCRRMQPGKNKSFTPEITDTRKYNHVREQSAALLRVGWYQYFLVPAPKFPTAQNSWFRFQWCQRCRHQLSYRHYHLGWHPYWSWYQHCIGVMAQNGFISKWFLVLLAHFQGKGSGLLRYLEVSSLLWQSAICVCTS